MRKQDFPVGFSAITPDHIGCVPACQRADGDSVLTFPAGGVDGKDEVAGSDAAAGLNSSMPRAMGRAEVFLQIFQDGEAAFVDGVSQVFLRCADLSEEGAQLLALGQDLER